MSGSEPCRLTCLPGAGDRTEIASGLPALGRSQKHRKKTSEMDHALGLESKQVHMDETSPGTSPEWRGAWNVKPRRNRIR